MRNLHLAASAFLLALTAAPFAGAQAQVVETEDGYVAPRNVYGQPSFEGVWTTNFILPVEALPNVPMLVLPEQAAAGMAVNVANAIAQQFEAILDPEIPEVIKQTDGLAIVRGQRRTRAVILPENGMLPLKPEVRKEMEAALTSEAPVNNYEERPNWERCLRGLGQAPVAGTGEENPRQFIQTRDHFLFHTEYGDEVRIIPYTDTHKPEMFHSYGLGDSIARWEGDTLVIETIGLPESDRIRFFPTFVVSHAATVTERLTRISENELLFQYTVEDPEIYTAPWLAEFSLYKTDQPMFEHACHEGNYSLTNVLQSRVTADARAPQR